MNVTTVFQITEYSLIDNSCMLVQSETQLRSNGGTVYYQLQEYSIEDISCMQKNSFLGDCIVTSEFGKLCERKIHTGGSQRAQEKLRKEIGGLED